MTKRKFCIAGPVDPKRHYFIPKRLDWNQLDTFISDQEYFVLHAPRQSGKTTSIEEYIQHLNTKGIYSALYINIESAQAAKNDAKEALRTILAEIKSSLLNQLTGQESTVQFITDILKEPNLITLNTLVDVLEFWAKASSIPCVLFIDEIDSLLGDALLSVLRQIRRGFTKRPIAFPQSLCLIGLRDVRDYRVWSKESGHEVSTSSPFNIKATSLTLSNFSLEQVQTLCGQYTEEAGQNFSADAIQYLHTLTEGQPWLVNALLHQVCFVVVTDQCIPITKEMIERAKDAIILRRDTHIDSLVDKLHEPRVRYIIDAIINGHAGSHNFKNDDLQYVRDLGLVTAKGIEIANPIYKEIIPRELTYTKQEEIYQKTSWYLDASGALQMQAMLKAFTQFYQENSSVWLEKFDYKESGPHLLLMAFLQRVINGGGRIHREYALGKKRVDLLVLWKAQKIVIELKLKSGEELKKGLEQTAQYMDASSATEGHLVIFDRDPTKSWQEKIAHSSSTFNGHTIHVWCM